VGDFWICSYTQNATSGDREYTPQLIFERKTWDDLIGSLESRRIYDQRGRLLETGTRSAFLVEGYRQDRVGFKGRDRRQVEKFLLHSQVRDGISVLYTDSQEETAEQLVHWLTKIQDSNFLSAKNGGKSFAECQRLERKAGMTFEACYMSQLMQYPGVSSSATAQCISGLYPNMPALCRAVFEDPHAVYEAIANVKVSSKRFGPVKAARLVEYVRGEEIDWKQLKAVAKAEKAKKRKKKGPAIAVGKKRKRADDYDTEVVELVHPSSKRRKKKA
jgi:hypothetical protein